MVTKEVTKEQVYDQLKGVMDPELMINVVDLGLIYEVVIKPQDHKITRAREHTPLSKAEDPSQEGSKIYINMTLTSPMCPLADTFEGMVTSAVKKLKGVDDVEVELTFDPPWNEGMMSEGAKAELGFF
jgi:metal-sulfur cluster biosynthetic enzyme